MSAREGAGTEGAVAEGVEGLEAIMRRGGEELRARMLRTERHLELVTARAGEPLAEHANATVRAGGKRLRPLLVVLAAESAGGPPRTREGEERLVRAAVAVELLRRRRKIFSEPSWMCFMSPISWRRNTTWTPAAFISWAIPQEAARYGILQ